ncbi:hypothetical protein B6I21_02500 [candidate division KSB1 bacterium 4572_119]|nr:MAG: hypothetical protein B6I21_02500 [candidate division KSB1 bacterium 4572_119]
MKRYLLVALIITSLLFVISCDKDDDNGTDPTTVEDWVGTWLSAGTDVAPILIAVFQYDSVRVEFKENNTITLESHVTDGAWTTLEGTYTITESASGSVHSAKFVYAAFEQEGIIEITEGTPSTMQLEVVQTVPDIGATPRTPDTGFGSDPTLGTMNIQKYVKLN